MYKAVENWYFRAAPYPILRDRGFKFTSHIYTAVEKWCFRGAQYPILRDITFRVTYLHLYIQLCQNGASGVLPILSLEIKVPDVNNFPYK